MDGRAIYADGQKKSFQPSVVPQNETECLDYPRIPPGWDLLSWIVLTISRDGRRHSGPLLWAGALYVSSTTTTKCQGTGKSPENNQSRGAADGYNSSLRTPPGMMKPITRGPGSGRWELAWKEGYYGMYMFKRQPEPACSRFPTIQTSCSIGPPQCIQSFW